MMNDWPERSKSVFYIPAGIAFIEELTKAILRGDLPAANGPPPQEFSLPDWTILLPTRRATRNLLQAFISHAETSALLMPRIQALGDIDEDEISLTTMFDARLGEPPVTAISSLEREFILMDLIKDWAEKNAGSDLADLIDSNVTHRFELARSLAKLVDSFETAGVEIAEIKNLFDGEFAAHRQQLLEFLSIIDTALPEILKARSKVNPAQFRNGQMLAYNDYLRNGQSRGPVIAAGSTGSIPATAELLSTIAKMPNGAVVLPGLDVDMDDDSWASLAENHPQFGMRELLEKLGLERQQVALLPGVRQSRETAARNWLVGEIMRPAHSTDQWRQSVKDGQEKLKAAMKNIHVVEARDQRREALSIALILRQAAEGKNSAALVTPDRTLARNVKAELKRWNMEVDDTAGTSLGQSLPARLLVLLLNAAEAGFSAAALKPLLAHPFCCAGYSSETFNKLFTGLEVGVLRYGQPIRQLDDLVTVAQANAKEAGKDPYAHRAVKNLHPQDWGELISFARTIREILAPLAKLFTTPDEHALRHLLQTHLRVAERLARNDTQPPVLWCGEAGKQLSDLFSHMLEIADLAPPTTASEYAVFVAHQIQQGVVRPKLVQQGHIAIYGLLEARLIKADIMVLSGLNEGVWPGVAQSNPWLSRPQLKQAGLVLPERKIGLSAHDFVQGFCAGTVYLTYSKIRDGAPSVPARWILRLRALLNSGGFSDVKTEAVGRQLAVWAEKLDEASAFLPVVQPTPRPPVHLRPRKFSVTGFEKLLKNPYRLFAEKVLHLSVLPPLVSQNEAAMRGSLIHAGLESFSRKYPHDLPENAEEKLYGSFLQVMDNNLQDDALKVYWRTELRRIASWFINKEKELRAEQTRSFVELSGSFEFSVDGESFSISAKADRTDALTEGGFRIIDYKTGTPPSLSMSAKSFSPQLPLEGLIGQNGGFKDAGQQQIVQLGYVKLSGGAPAGELKLWKKDIDQLIADCFSGMKQVLAAYNRAGQPYCANPQGEVPNSVREYDYLSRWREWGHLIIEGAGS